MHPRRSTDPAAEVLDLIDRTRKAVDALADGATEDEKRTTEATIRLYAAVVEPLLRWAQDEEYNRGRHAAEIASDLANFFGMFLAGYAGQASGALKLAIAEQREQAVERLAKLLTGKIMESARAILRGVE